MNTSRQRKSATPEMEVRKSKQLTLCLINIAPNCHWLPWTSSRSAVIQTKNALAAHSLTNSYPIE